MARKSRKCPKKARQRHNDRRRIDKGTPERLRRFELVVGRPRRNNKDNADQCIISLLLEWKYISNSQASIALAYYNLYWHYVSQMFRTDKQTTFARELVSDGLISMPKFVTEAHAEEREGIYKILDEKLGGGEVRRVVHVVTVEDKFPNWVQRKINCRLSGQKFNIRPNEQIEIERIKLGLNRMLER